MRGSRVRALRIRNQLTQERLARYAGVNQSYLSQIENEHIESVGSEILRKLAHRLNTTTDYLLGLTTDPEPRRSGIGYELSEKQRLLVNRFRQVPEEIQNMILAGLEAYEKQIK